VAQSWAATWHPIIGLIGLCYKMVWFLARTGGFEPGPPDQGNDLVTTGLPRRHRSLLNGTTKLYLNLVMVSQREKGSGLSPSPRLGT
jgi:hypothetical protein